MLPNDVFRQILCGMTLHYPGHQEGAPDYASCHVSTSQQRLFKSAAPENRTVIYSSCLKKHSFPCFRLNTLNLSVLPFTSAFACVGLS